MTTLLNCFKDSSIKRKPIKNMRKKCLTSAKEKSRGKERIEKAKHGLISWPFQDAINISVADQLYQTA